MNILLVLLGTSQAFAYRGEWNSQTNGCGGYIRGQIVECGDVSGPSSENGGRVDLDPEFNWLGKEVPGLKANRTRVPGATLSRNRPGQRTDLRAASFEDCQMAGVVIRGAYARDSSFKDTYMRNASLNYSQFVNADFRSADLQNASLKETDMRGTHLRGTNLSGSNLRGTDFREAREFNRGTFRGATFDEFTQFPFGDGATPEARRTAVETYGMVFVASTDPNPRPSASVRPPSERAVKPTSPQAPGAPAGNGVAPGSTEAD